MNGNDLSALLDVITSSDYKSCSAVKSHTEIVTMTVAKSYGDSHLIEARTNREPEYHYKSRENHSVGSTRR
jgi:hypothetical protein